MRFLLPSPIHGWRTFWGEVGIIVLGVLLALGAQQVVERYSEDRIAAQTREAIREEINQSLLSVSLRGTAEPCIQRRLNEIRALLNNWASTGTFETPYWIAQAPSLSIAAPSYQAADSAGHLALLSSEERYQLGSLMEDLEYFSDIQKREEAPWAILRMLQNGAANLSATDRTALRIALQDAANQDYRARLLIRQLLPRAAGYGYRPDRRRFDQFARTVWKSGKYTPAICAPIDTPPAQANEMTGQQTPLPF